MEKGIIERPRLLQKMGDIQTRKATFLIAPAGYGKTVAMAQFIAVMEQPVVWYQIDAYDNDPAIFLQYLTRGLQQYYPNFGEQFLLLLEQENIETRLRIILTKFINSLIRVASEPIIFVLDDFHEITSPLVFRFIQEFLEYLPSHVHIMIAGRVAPLFTFTRLQVADEILVIGAEDLSFIDLEVNEFLLKNAPHLSVESSAVLNSKVHGWPAAFRLAVGAVSSTAASLELHETNMGIYDYFAKEVFEQQPEEIREFLIKTSVFETISVSDSDVLRGRKDSAKILKWLEKQNLFLTPLAGTEKTYRYHQLFREFLLERLGPAKSQLQCEAGQIAEKNGDLAKAIEYYIASGTASRIRAIIKIAGPQALQKGRWQTVERWLGFFSRKEKAADPKLALLQAQAEAFHGRIEEVSHWVNLAIAEFTILEDRTGLAESRLLKARILRYQGFYQQSLVILENVTEILNDRDRLRFDLPLEKSLCLLMIGRFREAENLLKQALEIAENENALYTVAYLLDGLGNTYYLQGDYSKALQAYRKRSEVLTGQNMTDYYMQNYNAAIYQEWGELEQAFEYAKHSVEFKENYGLTDTLPSAYFQLGDIYLNRREPKTAEKYFRRAIDLTQNYSGEYFFLILNKAYLGISLSLQGRLSEAQLITEAALEEARIPGGLILALCQELAAQIFWRYGERQVAKEIVLEAAAVLEKMGFPRPLGHAYAFLTLSYTVEGDHMAAALYAKKTLEISAPRNFYQSFLTSFDIFQPVLRFGLEQGIEVPFIQTILARLGKQAFPLLNSLRNHPDPKVRWRTITPLSELSDGQALTALQALTEDPDTEVAETARGMLSRFASLRASENENTFEAFCFKTLGPFQIFQKGVGVRVNWRTSKSRDLLALLVHQGKPVSRDVIIEELWPEHDLEKAQSLFHTCLYYLRQILKKIGFPEIIYHNNTYSIKEGCYVDERRQFQDLITAGFRRENTAEATCDFLKRAITLYRGDYLEELDYPWFLPDREKLRNLYCEALLWVAGYHLQKEEFTQAIVYLENLIAINPLSEKPHRLLMTAYAGLKDWGLVRKSYHRLVDLLSGELGIAPTDETQELYKSWGL